MGQPDDVVARILTAEAGHAAALVLALPWQQTRAVLGALGPREVARLLAGARADRVPDLMEHIPPGLLPGVVAHLGIGQIAQLIPLLSVRQAAGLVQSMAPAPAAQLMQVLPTHQRMVLQESVPRPEPRESAGAQVTGEHAGEYALRAEQAVRRIAGRTSWLDPRAGVLLTEIFGRSVQVVAREDVSTVLTVRDVQAVAVATDWRRVGGLLVMTTAALDPELGAGLREARAAGYVVEAVQWLDDRDDGVLKRVMVRLVG